MPGKGTLQAKKKKIENKKNKKNKLEKKETRMINLAFIFHELGQ